MNKMQLSNLSRVLGYVISMACLAYFLMATNFADDLSQFSDEEIAEIQNKRFFSIMGCLVGVAFTIASVVLRYLPESEASIRRRYREEEAELKEEERDR